MAETVIIHLGRYRHHKGNLYDVIGLATHSETGEDLVVYRSVETGALWARPAAMFAEMVEVEGRTVARFAGVVGEGEGENDR